MANIAKQQERVQAFEEAIITTEHKIHRETHFLLELHRQHQIEKDILQEMLIPHEDSTNSSHT